jgi:hypothetical protein
MESFSLEKVSPLKISSIDFAVTSLTMQGKPHGSSEMTWISGLQKKKHPDKTQLPSSASVGICLTNHQELDVLT